MLSLSTSRAFLPHSFLVLLHLKFVDYNLLRTPHKEGMDSSDEFLLTTGYEPNAYGPQSSPTRSSWTRRRSSPTKSLLRTPTTMTPHSRMCFAKLAEYIAITLCEKTCPSVCRRRQCPIERGDPLEIERGDSLSKETRKHRLVRTLLDKQKEQILAECQARINKHEFQAAYDRRSMLKL